VPDCGHVGPHTLTQAFGKAAVDRGVTVLTKTAVTDVTIEDGRAVAIESEAGVYQVESVLNAAGPWAGHVADMVGVDIPIALMARRLMVTSPTEETNSPLVIDPERGCYFKSEKNGSLLICDTEQDIRDIEDPDAGTVGEVSYDYYLTASEKVEPLIPVVGDLDVINGWRGLQTHSPDGHAILGPTDVGGFHLACGFSGHGVQQAPTVGAAMADILAEGTTDVFDMDALSLDRFERSDGIDPEGMA